MSNRRRVEQRLHSLDEIEDIMDSMKTLAYMETRKLEHCLVTQLKVEKSIEAVASDFLGFFPETLSFLPAAATVCILIGSERGFCGEFNHKLLQHLEHLADLPGYETQPEIIAVGRKLHSMLEGDKRIASFIEGASVTEEISPVLMELIDQIVSLQEKHDNIDVYCLFYGEEGDVVMQRFLPPFQGLGDCPPAYSHPPVLTMPPAEFFSSLTEQYLFSSLHTMLYTSLKQENHVRMAHLEGAVHHLDECAESLQQKVNALRQEDIIEEIEVILLSAASLGDNPEKKRVDFS